MGMVLRRLTMNLRREDLSGRWRSSGCESAPTGAIGVILNVIHARSTAFFLHPFDSYQVVDVRLADAVGRRR